MKKIMLMFLMMMCVSVQAKVKCYVSIDDVTVHVTYTDTISQAAKEAANYPNPSNGQVTLECRKIAK